MFALDLSHNCLSDGAGRALGKLLNEHSPQLTMLDVSNNQLEEAAGISISHALQRNSTLHELNLSMNRLGDQGSQYILKALSKNKTLRVLNLSSNDMGEPSAPTLADVCCTACTYYSMAVPSWVSVCLDADDQLTPDNSECDVQQVGGGGGQADAGGHGGQQNTHAL